MQDFNTALEFLVDINVLPAWLPKDSFVALIQSFLVYIYVQLYRLTYI